MENAEEVLHFLEEFTKRKPKSIPQELNDYLAYVARTGDPVYQWSLVKSLFKEKLLNVITDFYETTPGLDIPPYPNVDPFNYDIMKNMLLERLDAFTAAPFTIQRICELLTFPRKQYNRIDKFMRAVEKNILVVSTREPGPQRHAELENGDPLEPIVNGSDSNSEYNVDVEMEDMSWKENAERRQNAEPQPSSSDAHISVDDVETRLQPKHDTPMEDTEVKSPGQYESVTPPDVNVPDEQATETKPSDNATIEVSKSTAEVETKEPEVPSTSASTDTPKMDTESNVEAPVECSTPLVIPEITVDDAEMTEQKIIKQASLESNDEAKPEKSIEAVTEEAAPPEVKKSKPDDTQPPQTTDESSSDSSKEEMNEPKLISEESTSSEESSSSSEITDGNSNSPKPDNETNVAVADEPDNETNVAVADEADNETNVAVADEADNGTNVAVAEESNPPDSVSEEPIKIENNIEEKKEMEEEKPIVEEVVQDKPQLMIQTDNYSISDVKSELPQPVETLQKSPETVPIEAEEELSTDVKIETEQPKIEPEAIIDKEIS